MFSTARRSMPWNRLQRGGNEMENVFLLLFLLSVIALVVGMVKPELVLKWLPESGRNRKKVVMYFVPALLISFVMFGVTADPVEEDLAAVEEVEAEAPPEEETAEEDAEREAEEQAAREAEEE